MFIKYLSPEGDPAGGAPAVPSVSAPVVAAAAVIAPAPAVNPVVPAAVAPAAAPVIPSGSPQEPAYIGKIKAEARRKAFADFGLKIGKDEDVDKAVADYKTKLVGRKEENKLLREALKQFQGDRAELDGKVTAADARATASESAIKSLLDVEIALLPADKRDTVKAALAGDAASQLKQLAALKALGMQFGTPATVIPPPIAPPAPGAPPVVAAPPVVPPPIAPPATSAPPQPGPLPTPPNPTDVKAQFTQLKNSKSKTDRVRAAVLALNHSELLLPDDVV